MDKKNTGLHKTGKSFGDRVGGALEKVGQKISDLGAKNLGQKIHDAGEPMIFGP